MTSRSEDLIATRTHIKALLAKAADGTLSCTAPRQQRLKHLLARVEKDIVVDTLCAPINLLLAVHLCLV